MIKLTYAVRIALTIGVSGAISLTACGGTAPAILRLEQAEHEDTHMEESDHEDSHMEESEHEDSHMEEHMAGAAHGIPEEAAAVPNPVDATDQSIEAGAGSYATNCVICHGESGAGDGPAAAGLDPKPADLHEAHVQELSDGALFYIITHGRSETAMPAWEKTLSEEERWNVVNFLRTFGG